MTTNTQTTTAGQQRKLEFRKGQKVLTIILPNIESMMTGVWRIQRAHDLTKLTYTDGSSESALIPTKRWDEIQDNVFSIVGTVQHIARKPSTPKHHEHKGLYGTPNHRTN